MLDEDLVTRSLARVHNEDVTLGTAFFVLPAEGVAITCHHLVEGRDRVGLDCGDGKRRSGIIEADDRFPEIDVALVRCEDDLPTSALPIEADRRGITRFWTKGFHHFGLEVTAALPASGDVAGATEIRFSTANETPYQLTGVLALKDDSFEGGLSGAPVLDPETGVVFALVNAKFTRSPSLAGFALPMSRLKEHSPRLARLFEANYEAVPRYGRFLNHLGAAEICRRQRDMLLERLVQREFFLRHLYVAREVERLIDAFYASNRLILPIVGHAGVGKSTLLAEMAQRANPRHTVLLLGHNLLPDESDIGAALTAQLREVGPRELGSEGDASLVAAALRRGHHQMTVLFDGLNEIPAPLSANVRGWIERTVEWVERNGVRLVITSRPEFWQLWKELFPKELLFAENETDRRRSEAGGVALRDFTDEEAEEARERYGLRAALSTDVVQHPLLVRVCWELQKADPEVQSPSCTGYRAWERFVEIKCERVARAVMPAVVKPYVEIALRRVATAALQKGGFEVTRDRFFDLVADNNQVGNRLLEEGIFTTTSSGVRFVFDEMAEFLHGLTVDVETIRKRFDMLNGDGPKLTTGAVVFAILRFDANEHDAQVDEAIRAVFAAHARGEDALTCEGIVVRLLPQIRRPERFAPEIEAMARRMARSDEDGFFPYDRFDLRHTVIALNLPLEFKLNLLKLFLPSEDYYEFELHHSDDLALAVANEPWHTAALIGELIQTAPQPAFEILTGWLGDMTPLHGGHVYVRDAAGALLFLFRHLAFERLCELLVRSDLENAESLMGWIARNDVAATVRVCLRWVEGDDMLLRDTAVWLAAPIATYATDQNLEDEFYAVFSRARGSVSPEIDVVAAQGIGRLPKYRALLVDELVALFKQGHPRVDGFTIAEWAPTHFDRIISVVEDLIDNDTSLERCAQVLFSVCRRDGSEEEKGRVIDLLKLGIWKGMLVLHHFRFAIENMLYNVDSELLRQKMADLVDTIIPLDSEVRVNLMYFAAGQRATNEYKARLQDEVLERLLNYEMKPENQARLVRQLAAKGLDRPDLLRYLLILGKRMDTERFYCMLLQAAVRHTPFRANLAEWVASDPRLPPVGPLGTFLERVRAGDEPRTAARNVLLESCQS